MCPVPLEQGVADGVGDSCYEHMPCLLALNCPLVAVLTALHSLPSPCHSQCCFRSCCAWNQVVVQVSLLHITLTLQTHVIVCLEQKYCCSVLVEGCLVLLHQQITPAPSGLKVSTLLQTSKMRSWLLCNELNFVDKAALAATYWLGILTFVLEPADCSMKRLGLEVTSQTPGFSCEVVTIMVAALSLSALLEWDIAIQTCACTGGSWSSARYKCCLAKVCCSLVFWETIF